MKKGFGVEVGGRLRAPAPAGLLRGMDREPRSARGHASRPGLSGGTPDAFQMAKDHPEVVSRCLRLKKLGNGYRGTHRRTGDSPGQPPGGGILQAPRKNGTFGPFGEDQMGPGMPPTKPCGGRQACPFPISSTAMSSWPCAIRKHTPSWKGVWSQTGGWTSPSREFEDHFEEEQVGHSTSLHAQIKGAGNLLGGAAGQV